MRNPPPLSPFAISCLNTGGTTGPLPHRLVPATSPRSPPLHPLPGSQSLDWVLITVTAGHSSRPQIAAGGGGPLTQSPPHYIVPLSLRPSLPLPLPLPILSGLRAALKHPVGHPSPHAAAPYRSVNPPTPTPQLPPHCSVLCLCGAGPIPPYVVLISTQRPSVKKPPMMWFRNRVHPQPARTLRRPVRCSQSREMHTHTHTRPCEVAGSWPGLSAEHQQPRSV